MVRRPRFEVHYRIAGGQERKTLCFTQDRGEIAATLAQVWKCRPEDVEIVDLQWYSARPVKLD